MDAQQAVVELGAREEALLAERRQAKRWKASSREAMERARCTGEVAMTLSEDQMELAQ